MSRFFSDKYSALTPYTPGEQPKAGQFIKLNTNENPYPPSPLAVEYAAKAAQSLHLYSNIGCTALCEKLAELYGIQRDQILFTNGSDEALNFCFMAFCDSDHPAVFADITYGFYPVFAALNGVPYEEIPLADDMSIRVEDYLGLNKTIFIANPNAPTGCALPISEIERIVSSNPDSIVVVDEAYADFGDLSAVSLIDKYDNLLVTQTFSKSRSLAGGRLGMAIGNTSLINDLNTIKFSTNPYNVSALTQAAGLGCLIDEAYTRRNIDAIKENRAVLSQGLEKIGFKVIPSSANFIFVRHPKLTGELIYAALREKGILVRHFTLERIKDYNRITVGTAEQVAAVLRAAQEITEEQR
jgi:histidinol-phosphate aminotransferase